jgi:hypothetical protein
MASSQAPEVLVSYIRDVVMNWPVAKLALQHGMGGLDTEAKFSQDLVHELALQFFDDPDPYSDTPNYRPKATVKTDMDTLCSWIDEFLEGTVLWLVQTTVQPVRASSSCCRGSVC